MQSFDEKWEIVHCASQFHNVVIFLVYSNFFAPTRAVFFGNEGFGPLQPHFYRAVLFPLRIWIFRISFAKRNKCCKAGEKEISLVVNFRKCKFKPKPKPKLEWKWIFTEHLRIYTNNCTFWVWSCAKVGIPSGQAWRNRLENPNEKECKRRKHSVDHCKRVQI